MTISIVRSTRKRKHLTDAEMLCRILDALSCTPDAPLELVLAKIARLQAAWRELGRLQGGASC